MSTTDPANTRTGVPTSPARALRPARRPWALTPSASSCEATGRTLAQGALAWIWAKPGHDPDPWLQNRRPGRGKRRGPRHRAVSARHPRRGRDATRATAAMLSRFRRPCFRSPVEQQIPGPTRVSI